MRLVCRVEAQGGREWGAYAELVLSPSIAEALLAQRQVFLAAKTVNSRVKVVGLADNWVSYYETLRAEDDEEYERLDEEGWEVTDTPLDDPVRIDVSRLVLREEGLYWMAITRGDMRVETEGITWAVLERVARGEGDDQVFA